MIPSLRFGPARCTAILTFALVATTHSQEATLDQFRDQVLSRLAAFDDSPETVAIRETVAASSTFAAIDEAIRPLVLAAVHINPEARVKVAASASRVDLDAGRPRRMLLRVENLAGIRAPMRLRGVDLAISPPSPAAWFELHVDGSSDPTRDSAPLSGTSDEVFVVEVAVDQPGTREVRLVADAGQGTQDLGFRATADVRFRASESDDSAAP